MVVVVVAFARNGVVRHVICELRWELTLFTAYTSSVDSVGRLSRK